MAPTSGLEETAGRSRLTSNRRLASGRRPGWLRPRKVSPSRTWANHSNRLRCYPPEARPPTGASSCKSTTTGHSSKLHPTPCPRSTSTASEHRLTQPAHVGKLRPATRSAQTPEKRHQSGCGAFRETRSGRPGRSSRGSRVAHQPEDRCGSAIDQASLRVMVLMLYASGSTVADLFIRQRGGFAGLTHGLKHKEP